MNKSSQFMELSVSLAVLTFNRDEECTRALESALRFGFKEILVLDNGSENRFESDLGRVIRSSQNSGVSAGRNRLVSEATGDFVLFLDDDAVLDDSTDLTVLVSEFDKNPNLSVIAGLFQRPDGVAPHEFPSRRWRIE
jgi:Predicted glycosyltransferases